jgi:hypothetical protein
LFKDFFLKKKKDGYKKFGRLAGLQVINKNPAFEGLESQDPHVVH